MHCRFVLSHASNAHAFRYQDGYYPVNEKRVPIQLHPIHLTHNGGVTVGTRSADTLELYHYMTKSVEEYKRKVGPETSKAFSKPLEFELSTGRDCVRLCANTWPLRNA